MAVKRILKKSQKPVELKEPRMNVPKWIEDNIRHTHEHKAKTSKSR